MRSRRVHRSFRIGLSGLSGLSATLVFATALTACSSAPSEASSAKTSAKKTPSDVNPNGVLRYGSSLASELPALAPTKAASCTYRYLYPVYDTLVTENPVTQQAEPGLAQSWTTPNRSTLVLHLRSGLTFQNSQPLNAAAVVTALDTNMASTSSLASNFKAVKDIKAVNPTTVEIDLSAPIAATFPLTLAGASGLIAEKDPSAPGGYSGAGPFKIVSYSPGVSLQLARWSGYWDAGSIKLGGIDFVNVTANAPAAAALRSGSIDVAEFAPESIPSLTGESYVVQNRQMYYMMTFNLGTAPFNNVKFRQALNYAVNRKAVDQVIDLGKGQPTDETYAKTFAAFSSAAAKLYPYNVKRAKKLLAEAGFPHGVTIHVITPPAVEVGLTEIADVLKQDFAAIGVTMDIQPVPLAAFLSSYYESKSSEAAVVLWTPPTNPAATLLEQFTPTGYENAAHYSNPGDYTNPKLNDLLAEAQSAPTAAARSKALQSATLLVTQQALSLPITFSPLVTAYDSQVGGTVVHLGYCSGITWSKVYMRK